MKTLYITMLALAVTFVPSCANYANPNQIAANEVGSVGEVIPGTFIQAKKIRIDASSTDKNLGTGIGAAVGAGTGQLLGGGSGRVVSTVGFGIAGALAGRAAGKYATQADGQELQIKADKGGKVYRIQQNIYQGIGEIPVGTHGYLTIGSRNNSFRPDGY